jgi:hypothetical protein
MKKNIVLIAVLTSAFINIKVNMAQAQPPLGALLQRFSKLDSENVSKPYKGITTSKGKEIGLFPITSTGVTTNPIKLAGELFLKSLAKGQLKKTQFDVNSDEWQHWANLDNGIYKRNGISIKEMSKEQRKLAFQFMQKALSAKGLKLSKDIMKTDQTLRELNNGDTRYDEDLYFFTVMGKPSMTQPWGWQIDGHHLVINYFILGDQVVMTPTFMGGEPIITASGKYKGNTLFQDEQNIGLKFMQSLSTEQQKQAVLSQDKGRNNIAAEAFSDNKTLDYQGLSAAQMTEEQKKNLLHLTNQYISNMDNGHAEVKMTDITNHLDNTWFAWIGKTDENAVFYYRIHSPVILIEFDHQAPVGLPEKGREATRNHIHTMVRTPNGNDYGKDLLKEHLEKYHHHD